MQPGGERRCNGAARLDHREPDVDGGVFQFAARPVLVHGAGTDELGDGEGGPVQLVIALAFPCIGKLAQFVGDGGGDIPV